MGSQFTKQVAIVAGGTAGAQLITVAFSPIITRLYGPEAFGTLGVFAAMVSLAGTGACLAYWIAVVLPVSDAEARQVVKLSLASAAVVSLLLLWMVVCFGNDIADVFGFAPAARYLVLLPIVVFFSGIEQTLRQWLIRKRQFRAISGVTVTQAAGAGSAMAIGGLVAPTGPTLLVLNAFGHAVYAGLLWLVARSSLRVAGGSQREGRGTLDTGDLRRMAHKYRDFPYYRTPQLLLNAASYSAVPLVLAALFGPVQVGFYALSQRVLALPGNLVSQSIGTALLPRLALRTQRGEKLQPLVLRATVGLAAVGILPFGAVVIFAPSLFSVVFGAEWVTAGEYARWLAIWLYFGLMDTASVHAVPMLGLQRQFLVFELAAVGVRVTAIAYGAMALDSASASIALLSVAGALMHVVRIVWIVRRSGGSSRESLGYHNASGEGYPNDT